MNEIEKMFYNAFLDNCGPEQCIQHHPRIGVYQPDFLAFGVIVEIDGHEYHKTKEQREKDYKRERYFQREGYTVIRFMGTEVFLDASGCINEFLEIITKQTNQEILQNEEGEITAYKNMSEWINKNLNKKGK